MDFWFVMAFFCCQSRMTRLECVRVTAAKTIPGATFIALEKWSFLRGSKAQSSDKVIALHRATCTGSWVYSTA